MKKKVITSILLIGLLLVSIVFVYSSEQLTNRTAKIVDDEFVLTFLGIFSGLSITIVTFLYSNIESIRNSLKSKAEKFNEIDYGISQIFTELKQDTIVTLGSLIISFFTIILKDCKFRFIEISATFITKSQLVSIIEIYMFLITFLAIFDLFISLFNLIKISQIIGRSKK